MAKIITSKELATLASCLLVKPEVIGELDDLSRYESFVKDIAEVIANHCGGEVVNVRTDTLESELPATYVALDPNASLPSLNNNACRFA